jgi:uncharacterized protein YjbJ (UPF0337 family)
MSLQDRAKATAKDVEGKLQEALGDLTGDPKAQAEGKGKQVEAKVRHAVEDAKDAIDNDQTASIKHRAKATAKNLEGKLQEGLGNMTDDPQNQSEGKKKQGEAKVQHTTEDVKDEIKKLDD